MDTRPLAALVSSLVSQALLLVLLLTQSNPDLLLVFTSLPRTGPLLPISSPLPTSLPPPPPFYPAAVSVHEMPKRKKR
ncbi:hypothetical protein HPP92_026249 [Vanilla planifolia]|uniref:Uncharacterized protein n=1 Tax=Vanilla planifolia TaxID=51239 RepID=A0A835PEA4_VANPL|nr:hypothetical protein HPP92_026249 [Vanilla planifolia]